MAKPTTASDIWCAWIQRLRSATGGAPSREVQTAKFDRSTFTAIAQPLIDDERRRAVEDFRRRCGQLQLDPSPIVFGIAEQPAYEAGWRALQHRIDNQAALMDDEPVWTQLAVQEERLIVTLCCGTGTMQLGIHDFTLSESNGKITVVLRRPAEALWEELTA